VVIGDSVRYEDTREANGIGNNVANSDVSCKATSIAKGELHTKLCRYQ